MGGKYSTTEIFIIDSMVYKIFIVWQVRWLRIKISTLVNVALKPNWNNMTFRYFLPNRKLPISELSMSSRQLAWIWNYYFKICCNKEKKLLFCVLLLGLNIKSWGKHFLCHSIHQDFLSKMSKVNQYLHHWVHTYFSLRSTHVSLFAFCPV